MEIKNKIAIVTGASSGIGLATAKLLTEMEAKVALTARNEEILAGISMQLPGSMFTVCDMTKEKEIIDMVSQVIQHFGRIDILINNAGYGYDAPVERTNLAIMRDLYNLDVFGPLIAMKQVIPEMRKTGGGSIVNISSGTALMSLPNNGAYSSAKKALAQLSLVAHEELKKDKIMVSVVYPYITKTPFEARTIRDESIHETPEEAEQGGPQPPDTPEFVAGIIANAIRTGKSEVVAHDWMKNL